MSTDNSVSPRPRTDHDFTFSDKDIEQAIISMGISSYISSIVEDAIKKAEFHPHDFMGSEQSLVSVDDIVISMLYYAFTVGKKTEDPMWEDECYEDFSKRDKTFNKVLKKVEISSTKTGSRKISSVKKKIRSSVESKEFGKETYVDPIGVFTESRDMEEIVNLKDAKKFVMALHSLGDYPEEDPRYYIHTIFRFHINEAHNYLCESGKVMRFPTIQRWMDIFTPVSSITNLPPEFRDLMRRIGASQITVVTLPVPSKTAPNTVVYGYDFESIPWVRFMRQEISKFFLRWKTPSCEEFLEVYPKNLVLGNSCNKVTTDVLAKSTEMETLMKSYESMMTKNVDTKIFIDISTAVPEVADIHCKYNNKVFNAPGEQLRERRGFFLNSMVRNVFQDIFKKNSSFCNDVYDTLSISYDILPDFEDYCGSKKSMKNFLADNENMWRVFIQSMEKICMVFHVVSRIKEVNDFYCRYGSPESFVREMFSEEMTF